MRSKVPVGQMVTMAVLVIGLGFGVWQVKQSQDIKKGKASYCGMCSPHGDCECDGGNQTGYKCNYAPDECSNLGNTWQPDSSCTVGASCEGGGNGGGGATPTPTPMPTPDSSCRGKNPVTSCSGCGGQNQNGCGIGDNSTTCNCNSGNAPCDSGFSRQYTGKCSQNGERPGPTPTPTPFSEGKKTFPSPTPTHERAATPRPKPTPTR